MKTPLVSVVIPVFNAERYIDEALASVEAQSHPDLEIITVNDGSTDGSLDRLRRHASSIRIIESANLGCGAARNLGVRAARGRFLAFLDADDYWSPDKLSRQLHAFHADPNLELCHGGYLEFASPDCTPAELAQRTIRSGIIPGPVAGTCLVTTAAFHRVGYFAEQWKVGEFVDWFARAQELRLKCHALDGCVLHRRNHRDNGTVREKAARTDYLEVVKAALERRRSQNRLNRTGSALEL